MAKGNLASLSYTRITSASSKQITASDTVLGKVLCSAGISPTITVIDGSSSGTTVLNAFPLTPGQAVELNIALTAGLYVTIGGTSPDVTIAWAA
jgi:hypothetical protein